MAASEGESQEPKLSVEKSDEERMEWMENPVTITLSLVSPMAHLSVSATYDDPSPAVIAHVTEKLRGALNHLVAAPESATAVKVSR